MSIKQFISNTWRFRKVLWELRPYEPENLLLLMKTQLEWMEKDQREDAYHTNAKAYAKDIRICIHLIDRITKDDYLKLELESINRVDFWDTKWVPKHEFPSNVSFCCKMAFKQKEDDFELLMNILRRKLLCWWS